MSESVLEQLNALADDIRADIKQARSVGDNERRSYLRGELQGILAAHDIVADLLESFGQPAMSATGQNLVTGEATK